MTDQPTRIAMWSGPRNISTAMMRAWGNREDTFVTDEPLYAYYLKTTGYDHPIADRIIEHYENDWRKVLAWLTGPVPEGKPIWYQKVMCHHMLEEVELDFVDQFVNCFLIREPAEMITSLIKILPEPTIEETGYPQQLRLYDHVRDYTGQIPPVLDAKDVLLDPPQMLRKLCERIGVPFDDNMLTWPPGRRETDGIWAPHWYGNVNNSTGFAPYKPKNEPIPDKFKNLHAEAEEMYTRIYALRIRRQTVESHVTEP